MGYEWFPSLGRVRPLQLDSYGTLYMHSVQRRPPLVSYYTQLINTAQHGPPAETAPGADPYVVAEGRALHQSLDISTLLLLTLSLARRGVEGAAQDLEAP